MTIVAESAAGAAAAKHWFQPSMAALTLRAAQRIANLDGRRLPGTDLPPRPPAHANYNDDLHNEKIALALALLGCFCFRQAHAQHLSPACNDYERTLEAMRTADQALRQGIGVLSHAPEQNQEQIKKVTGHIILVDRINTGKLVALVEECGWPRPKIHGAKAVDYAWLIAQHADMNQTAQRAFLKHLRQAVDNGDSPAYTYAFLVDRIALNEGKPQQYGTQVENNTECDVVIVPLDDHAKADARRQAIGWPSLQDYVALLTEHLRGKGCAALRVAIGTALPPPLYH